MTAGEAASGSTEPRRSLAGIRHQARHYALQALYQWQMTGQAPQAIEAEFLADYDFSRTDTEYFCTLLRQVTAQADVLDGRFRPYLTERSLDELGPVERAALRIGAWELLERLDIPYRVAINEGVALAKKFGATDSHKFVNAVLDKLAHEVRATEIGGVR